MNPGEYLLENAEIELNPGKRTVRLHVDSTGDRPIQVGSHTHFFEVNRALRFDRDQAYGYRLNIPSGTAARFEPGQGREVELVEMGGLRRVYGMAGLVMGDLSGQRSAALQRAAQSGHMGGKP